MKAQIHVVGAGVAGLTCAVLLQEQGARVEVFCREMPQDTTSAIAAAMWLPYRIAPQDLAVRWSLASLQVFEGLMAVPQSGVMRRSMMMLGHQPSLLALQAHGLQVERIAGGYSARLPVIVMPTYLAYLQARLLRAGGRITQRDVDLPGFLHEGADWVINCAGLGAQTLCGDTTMFAIAGQVVRVARGNMTHGASASEDDAPPTYIVVREDDCILGGTASHTTSCVPDTATTQAILARCRALMPEVASLTVLDTKVGLRPGRPSVRLEREGRLIHNYGHGGAGVTVSWGCAQDVAKLVATA